MVQRNILPQTHIKVAECWVALSFPLKPVGRDMGYRRSESPVPRRYLASGNESRAWRRRCAWCGGVREEGGVDGGDCDVLLRSGDKTLVAERLQNALRLLRLKARSWCLISAISPSSFETRLSSVRRLMGSVPTNTFEIEKSGVRCNEGESGVNECSSSESLRRRASRSGSESETWLVSDIFRRRRGITLRFWVWRTFGAALRAEWSK